MLVSVEIIMGLFVLIALLEILEYGFASSAYLHRVDEIFDINLTSIQIMEYLKLSAFIIIFIDALFVAKEFHEILQEILIGIFILFIFAFLLYAAFAPHEKKTIKQFGTAVKGDLFIFLLFELILFFIF